MNRLAVKVKQNNMYARKPDLNFLNKIANEVNSINLPSIPENPNILLPPPEYSLVRNNFQIFSEELSFKLNNPNLENEFKDEENELNSLNNKSKTRQSLIGIKRNAEKLSLSSTFKKRRLESENNIKMNNANSIEDKIIADKNIKSNREKNSNENKRNKNNFQIRNDDYNEKSDNNDYNDNEDFNNENDNEENEGDEYDQIDPNSNNTENEFDYRNHEYNNLEDDF